MAQSWIVLAQAGGGGFDPKTFLPMMIALAAIWYFLLIRPQQKQAADQRAMLGALKKGDDVITTSGLLGKVYAVSDKVITVEIANNVRVRMLKSAVQTRGAVADEAPVPAKADAKVEQKEEK